MAGSELVRGGTRRRGRHARADFSGFTVGAALETADGTIITGCNIENASYGLTICAERVAMFKAISEGHTKFRASPWSPTPPTRRPPCGACRQILWEFGGDLEVVLANLRRETARSADEGAAAVAVRRAVVALIPAVYSLL